ncbi:hypothetical protein [Pseudomonas sp. KU43P]|uniref:hypothetical protein n=1 Tax=Pseudomonas sp. KU43P TaxID=2487887 RepID=UPI0012A970A4|nr:hypothetical protein [Pseudomonas sp. KU43P]BBH43529.1 hypothetical protein KU43P_00060 [Pseudomonas sp. KU43P]
MVDAIPRGYECFRERLIEAFPKEKTGINRYFKMLQQVGDFMGIHSSYGLALTPKYFLHNRPGTKTEIRNLYLCGASTRTGHGIFGAMTGGVEAAAAVSGRKVRYQIMDIGTRAEAQTSL